MSMESKYKHLLQEDMDVKRWYENLAARSIITAGVYLRTLGLYCEMQKVTPKGIVEQVKMDEKGFRDSFHDFVRILEHKGKAGSYIARFKKAMINWLSFNGIEVRLRVNIRGENESPRVARERVPSKDELAKIIRMATPRARVAIALMAYSGLRPESIGNYNGTDGLRIADIPEARLTEQGIEFENVPAVLLVRSMLSKARHQYFTFLGGEAVTYIRDYIKRRLDSGEHLTLDSPLLALDARGVKRNRFLRTNLVTRDIKEAIVKAGYRWRPYVLRAYCDTNLIIAESKGLISHPYLQFIMGHKGDIEARYSTNKGILPPDMVEDMRESYRKCLHYLEAVEGGGRRGRDDEESITVQLRRQLLMVAGYKQEEIEHIDLASISDEEFQELVRSRLLVALTNNGVRQKVISVMHVEDYIAQGWEFVALLPDDRVIVRLP